MSARTARKPESEADRHRRIAAEARKRAERPLPSADGGLPDFDTPGNLIRWADARRSIADERERAEAERPRGGRT